MSASRAPEDIMSTLLYTAISAGDAEKHQREFETVTTRSSICCGFWRWQSETMGQNQSKFESPKKSSMKLKPPSEWKNDAEFEVVSPLSDISNPSQFRGRQLNHQTHSVRRDRTSKVCPKQKPSTGIPAPSRFYFQTTESDTNENIAPVPATKSVWLKSMKNKCSKAKTQLADCFIQKDENIHHTNELPRDQVGDAKPAARKTKKYGHDDYLQFKPVLQETLLKDSMDDVYLQHFTASSSQEESQLDKVHMSSRRAESKQSSHKRRALSLESSKNDNSRGPSGSVQDHSLKYSSNLKPAPTRPFADTGIFRTKTSGAASEPIEQTQTSESMRLRASISKAESIDGADKRRASVGQQVQEQINQKTKSTRVQRLRQQYQEELHRISSGAANKEVDGDRYAVSTSRRASSVPKRVSMAHEKKDLEEAVVELKKVDAKTQREEKPKPHLKGKRSVSAPRPSLNGSAPKRVSMSQAKDTADACTTTKKGGTKTQGEEKAKRPGKNRRSVSAPRPSLDGSALLHLTGWKAPTTKPSQPMPALLKIAGWNIQESETQRPSLSKNKQKALRKLGPSTSVTSMKNAMVGGKTQPGNKSNEAPTQPGNKSNEAPKERKISSKDQKTSCIDKKSASKVQDTVGKDQETARNNKKHKDTRTPSNEHSKLRSTKSKKKSKKKTRFSDPLPLPQASDQGKSIATILQQAYFGDIREKHVETMVKDYSASQQLIISKSDSMLCSPSTVATGSPKPAISDEADVNAHFLFQADENNIRVLPTKTSSSHSISTIQSRSRMNVHYQAAEIPPPASARPIETQESRQVRFSDDSKTLKVPDIEHKYSDLTESTSGRDSSVAMSIPRIDSIPEEEEDDEPSSGSADIVETMVDKPSSSSMTVELYRSPTTNLFDEGTDAVKDKRQEAAEEKKSVNLMTVETDDKMKDIPNDEETPKIPISRWSYRGDGSLSTGVTPLIDGRNHANLVTNSPYLRYQEAKERFNGGKGKKNAPKKKESPIKRKSPSKRAVSLVTSRVAAMEAKNCPQKRIRRATTDRNVSLAPRHCNLKSPSLLRTVQTKNLSRGSHRAEIILQTSTPMGSVVSENSSEDEFGRILHSNAIDEDSTDEHNSPKVSDCDESCDEFDNIRKCDESDSAGEDESPPSVATLRARFSMESEGSSTTEAASVATTLQRRRLLDTMSIISSSSSYGDTASLTSSIFSKTENVIPSAVQRMRAKNLPFRDVSSVKPNEQSLGTPMQARKWRAYAAAAHEKSLSVRNLNMQ